ncbi:MAG: DUF308 domain-containing protein [Acetivibrio sp.]
MKKEEKKDTNGEKLATHFVISIALIYILLGALLLFVPQIQITTFCYLLCAVLVIFGIIAIVRYFLTDAYKNINEYGFSMGVFCVILGMCALVKITQVAESFLLCIGIALLMTSVIKFQNALDLKNLKDKPWFVMLGISFAFMICSVIIIINPFKNPNTVNLFTYRVLILDGFVSLISNFYLFLKIRSYRKERKKEASMEEDSKQEYNENKETKESEDMEDIGRKLYEEDAPISPKKE